jgi:UDP-N-acetylmuramate dehydrogenase
MLRRLFLEDLFYQKLVHIISEGQIKYKEPMENHTSLHIGGEADYFVSPKSVDEVRDVISMCRQENIPYYVMGNGSNLLVSDLGYRGLILKLGEDFSMVTVKEDGLITAQAGVLLSKLANIAAQHSLTGFEFASGIPGTLGGAVTMNAGAYDGEIKQCLTGARLMDESGNIFNFCTEDFQLGYRSSILQSRSYIVLEADIRLATGDETQIRQKMNELNRQRREKQPIDQYSAGSTFKRSQGYYAGKLIGDAGLRGYQVGGAAVSEKHCGFIINKEHATAKEFLAVIHDVIRIVEEKSAVRLEPEVKFLGEFK